MTTFRIKRIYAATEKSDGYRVLVDRLWPRGIKKSEARIDNWIKDLAPSAELRKWFNHEPDKWDQFKKSYQRELEQNDSVVRFKEFSENYPEVTLLYAAKDEIHNHAAVLKNLLESEHR